MKPVNVFLSILSGLLLTLGFPTPEMYYLSWVALLPLLFVIYRTNGKEAFLLGLICGLVHYVTTMYWIRHVVYYYGGLPLPLALLVLLILCAYMALYIAAFAYLANRWKAYPLLWLLVLPGLWVTLEWIRAHALTGFPWANLGYTQTPFTTLLQLADIAGVYGVGWLIVLGNTTLAFLWLHRSRSRAWALVFIGCFAGAIAYGSVRLETIKNLQDQVEPVSVGVVQGNIDQSLKWDPAFQQETLTRYRQLSIEAATSESSPRFLVWPETAAPFFYGVDETLTRQVNEIVRETGVPLLFGSPAVTLIRGEARLLNRAYLLDSSAVLKGAYAKQHLVPFGEYVPYQRVLFFVSKLVQAAGDFAAGTDPSPLMLGDYPLGMLICYEGIFPELARQTVKSGATALVNITNDAWYGKTTAPYQHKEISRWRSVEFRVPLIRAANTGISTIFDATGRPCGDIPLGERGYLNCDVRPLKVLTIYAKWGDFFALLCAVLTCGALMYAFSKRESVNPN
jgi:apolipoprotein N-acyltransferase